MGELTLNAEHATIRLDGYGKLWRRDFQSNNEYEIELTTNADKNSFGGGCVKALIDHVIAAKQGQGELENDAESYLPVMRIADACYESNRTGSKITL